jgi:hypothetical protein
MTCLQNPPSAPAAKSDAATSRIFAEGVGDRFVQRHRSSFRFGSDQRGVVGEGGLDPLMLFALPLGENPMSS